MASGHTGNVVPGNRLRVRISVPSAEASAHSIKRSVDSSHPFEFLRRDRPACNEFVPLGSLRPVHFGDFGKHAHRHGPVQGWPKTASTTPIVVSFMPSLRSLAWNRLSVSVVTEAKRSGLITLSKWFSPRRPFLRRLGQAREFFEFFIAREKQPERSFAAAGSVPLGVAAPIWQAIRSASRRTVVPVERAFCLPVMEILSRLRDWLW